MKIIKFSRWHSPMTTTTHLQFLSRHLHKLGRESVLDQAVWRFYTEVTGGNCPLLVTRIYNLFKRLATLFERQNI